MFKRRQVLIIFTGIISTIAVGVKIGAQTQTLLSLRTPVRVTVNSIFLSPLDELFGDVSVGKKVFVAGNTTLRADPSTRICIGDQTNVQDNTRFLAKIFISVLIRYLQYWSIPRKYLSFANIFGKESEMLRLQFVDQLSLQQ